MFSSDFILLRIFSTLYERKYDILLRYRKKYVIIMIKKKC